MKDFYKINHSVTGVKGLVYLGKDLLMYKRDNKTEIMPYCFDVPGGGSEYGESPFVTFKREVKEEFGIEIDKRDIVYAKKYKHLKEKGKFTYFVVAELPNDIKSEIKFGDEGLGYLFMTEKEFIKNEEIWPIFHQRGIEYFNTKNRSKVV